MRHENYQAQMMHQQQLQELKLQMLTQQRKLIQDKRREIETDLHILNQIESLSSRLILVDGTKMTLSMNELTSQLKQNLINLEQSENQSSSQQLNSLSTQTSAPMVQDLYVIQSPASACSNSELQQSIIHVDSLSPSVNEDAHQQLDKHSPINILPALTQNSLSVANLPSGSQQDSDNSLEFIIRNYASSKDGLHANISSLPMINDSSDQVSPNPSTTPDSQPCGSQQATNYETLTVTFTSVDRRQAFLQAFLEAKQLRLLQLQQQRQFQQHKIFTSSVTLRLSQPDSPSRCQAVDPRRNRLQHQDELDGRVVDNPNRDRKIVKKQDGAIRISSTPYATSGTGTIVHQMSAPQSLVASDSLGSPDGSNKLVPSHCTSCSDCSMNSERRQHHHHHQLIHQPASHPALLNTICCHEPHDNEVIQMKLCKNDGLINLDENFNDMDTTQPRMDQSIHLLRKDNNSIITLPCDIDRCNIADGRLIDQSLLFKFTPKFMLSLPMDFLNTQHPALQFTSSTSRQNRLASGDCKYTVELAKRKHQTVRDNSGQLWLCMSNGYVSHVALLSLRKQRFRRNSDRKSSDECYNVVPIILSAGDICKSHINCAAQVKYAARDEPPARKLDKELARVPTELQNLRINDRDDLGDKKLLGSERKPLVEVSIKSASPPIDIQLCADKSRQNTNNAINDGLSSSAPADALIHHGETNYCDKLTSISVDTAQVSKIAAYELADGNVDKLEPGQHPSINVGSKERQSARAMCRRSHHHSHDHLRGRTRVPSPCAHPNHHKCAANYALSYTRSHKMHHHHNTFCNQHHQHHLHSHHHGHHHQHHLLHHHHHHHTHHPHHHLYHSRHHTVPLAELRRALERQKRISDDRDQSDTSLGHHLVPPTNTPCTVEPGSIDSSESINETSRHPPFSPRSRRSARSTTPPTRHNGQKNFRSARMLRHQASLKTSSILAKLVGGATKGSFYSRKAGSGGERHHSDADDNDTDIDAGSLKLRSGSKPEDSSTIDNLLALTVPGANKSVMNCSSPNVVTIVSPLSSVSSLNSTNSSITVNSACASSSNHGSCTLLNNQWSSINCCAIHGLGAPSGQQQPEQQKQPNENCSPFDPCGIRSRSATMPSRALYQQLIDSNNDVCPLVNYANVDDGLDANCDNDNLQDQKYNVSAIIGDQIELLKDVNHGKQGAENDNLCSLWLGCEDGSLIMIECLTATASSGSNDCNLCDQSQRDLVCRNVHSEIKLDAAICDIKTFNDSLVFVALSNGQLAVFSRSVDHNSEARYCSFMNPKILTLTSNELNSMSKLCIVDDKHLWYSYGRNIFVLDINSMTLETTIMAPTNDRTIQSAMQSITIENMELAENLNGVWVSFKSGPLIQFYDIHSYKLLLEMSLLDPINKVLSYGNEIIRQHKTACLRATSLLNVQCEERSYNSLFVGTSAGIIIYLTIRQEQLREHIEAEKSAWNPQVISLRHGHSGQVKFLHLVELEDDTADDSDAPTDSNNNQKSDESTMCLISGGAGIDLYGPNNEQQVVQHLNSEEDCVNRLILWNI